jgi:hypothetical protein
VKHLGFAKETDPETRGGLRNFPLTHVGLINAALAIAAE